MRICMCFMAVLCCTVSVLAGDLQLQSGASGDPSWFDGKVLQVIDGKAMLVRIKDRRTGGENLNELVILRGYPTDGVTDGKFISSWDQLHNFRRGDRMTVLGTETYKTVIGTKTVFVLGPSPPPAPETPQERDDRLAAEKSAAERREALRAAEEIRIRDEMVRKEAAEIRRDEAKKVEAEASAARRLDYCKKLLKEGKISDAIGHLKELLDRYPSSKVTEEARRLLKDMEKK